MSAHNYLRNGIRCFLILSYIMLGPIINTCVKPKLRTGNMVIFACCINDGIDRVSWIGIQSI